jgi:hypothetical protein
LAQRRIQLRLVVGFGVAPIVVLLAIVLVGIVLVELGRRWLQLLVFVGFVVGFVVRLELVPKRVLVCVLLVPEGIVVGVLVVPEVVVVGVVGLELERWRIELLVVVGFVVVAVVVVGFVVVGFELEQRRVQLRLFVGFIVVAVVVVGFVVGFLVVVVRRIVVHVILGLVIQPFQLQLREQLLVVEQLRVEFGIKQLRRGHHHHVA